MTEEIIKNDDPRVGEAWILACKKFPDGDHAFQNRIGFLAGYHSRDTKVSDTTEADSSNADGLIKKQVAAIRKITAEVIAGGKESCIKFLKDAGIWEDEPVEENLEDWKEDLKELRWSIIIKHELNDFKKARLPRAADNALIEYGETLENIIYGLEDGANQWKSENVQLLDRIKELEAENEQLDNYKILLDACTSANDKLKLKINHLEQENKTVK